MTDSTQDRSRLDRNGLDRTDLAILDELQRNGRLTNAELAARVQLASHDTNSVAAFSAKVRAWD